MTLITLLLALALERFLGYMSDFRDPDRLNGIYVMRFCDLLDTLGLKHAGFKLLLIVLPPILLVGWLQSWLSSILLGVFSITLGVFVLLYCFGPENLEEEINNYVEAVAVGDEVRQHRVAGRLLQDQAPKTITLCARQLVSAIFAESNERLFTVIFWFVILGPAASVLYRLAHNIGRMDLKADEANEEDNVYSELARTAAGLAALMEWAPARLTALGYAVTGSFDHALVGMRGHFWGKMEHLREGNRQILSDSGTGAIRLDELFNDEMDAAGLNVVFTTVVNHIHRNLIVWLAVLALLTLGGWTS